MRTTKEPISTRGSIALKQQVKAIAENDNKDVSRVVRDAIMDYVARRDDVERSEAMEHILENWEGYRQAMDEEWLIELENRKIKNSFNEYTFLNFVDRSLAQVYFCNRDYYEDEELEKLLQNHLQSFKKRAEWHGYEDRLQLRYDDPIKYAVDWLEKKSQAKNVDADLV